MVPHGDAPRVRDGAGAISVRLESSPAEHPARPLRFAAGASHALPGEALSEHFGGPVAVEGDAQRGARTVDAIFEVTLALTDAPDGWIGERAWVRFAHPAEPLARQWGRSARQLLVRFFEGQ